MFVSIFLQMWLDT